MNLKVEELDDLENRVFKFFFYIINTKIKNIIVKMAAVPLSYSENKIVSLSCFLYIISG